MRRRPFVLRVLSLAAFLALAGQARTAAAGEPVLCSPVVPESLLVEPFHRVLFYGDSLTVGMSGTPAHYANVVRRVLADSYCDFELFEVAAIGRRGSHYVRYARRLHRDLVGADLPYDVVMFQDAGRALRLSFPRDPTSRRSFPAAVEATTTRALELDPAIQVVLATTPPLDLLHATSSWQSRYAKVDDYRGHNQVLRDFGGANGFTIVDWAVDACAGYDAAPGALWTRDGLHPRAFGNALLGLSVLKAFGVPRVDLVLDGLASLSAELDLASLELLADWIYNPPAQCEAESGD